MNDSTSFISEHTVGLSIVPILKEILYKQYKQVTPIFPWMSREGGSVSKEIHQAEKFKIIGLYPRRPKILIRDKENIYLNISEQIVLGAQSGKSLGIPIIAGLPLAKDFWQLGQFLNCLWMKLDFESFENKFFQINQKKGTCLDTGLTERIFQTDNAVLDFFNQSDKFFDIQEALEAFKKIKMDSSNMQHYSSFAYMGGYKPIYFLIK